MRNECPSLSSNRYMLLENLDISLQGSSIHIGRRRQPIPGETFFFVNNWTYNDIPYILYAEIDLCRIHPSFRNPSLIATFQLLKTSSIKGLQSDTKKALAKIFNDARICIKNAQVPRRFHFTIGRNRLLVNHWLSWQLVVLDMIFINDRAILYIVN